MSIPKGPAGTQQSVRSLEHAVRQRELRQNCWGAGPILGPSLRAGCQKVFLCTLYAQVTILILARDGWE